MKPFFGLALLLFMSLEVFSQGSLWLMGYNSGTGVGYGGTNLNFTSSSVVASQVNRPMNFNASNSAITDNSGNLLFYTNGFYIANANNDTMLNGSGLCSDPFTLSYQRTGLPISQGALILPAGGTKYYLFHEEFNENDSLLRPNKLLCSTIDMSLDNGLGGVVSKSVPVIRDVIRYGCLTACRHANGRDWWILIPKSENNLFHKLLVTAYGITSSTQNVGIPNPLVSMVSASSQSCFSPDGSKYAHFDPANGLSLFDFDRCTGFLSNPKYLTAGDLGGQIYTAGVAFSPNSRLLYLTNLIKLFQIDISDSLLVNSIQLIDTYDGFTSPFATTFYTAQLAENGKIYICATNGVNYYHVINNPDSIGIACNFQQHSFLLPTYSAITIGTPPNFRLGTEIGSVCDTIALSISEDLAKSVSVFPNPTTNVIYINFTDAQEKHYVEILNITGGVLIEKELQYHGMLDLANFEVGIYFLRVITNRGNYVKRIVKY